MKPTLRGEKPQQEFWNDAWNEDGLFETLPKKVQAELYDFEKMISTWSWVTYTLTGGKLSHPNYHEQVIVSEFEDYVSEQIREGVEEEIAQAQQEAVKRGKLEAYKEVMAFRSPYLYDDYSSLYQHSKELQKEYYEEMGKFLKKKIGLYENE